jgi:large subunit ribosomal protein L2
MLDAITLNLHKKCLNGKFGYWRTFGKKPLVRGVAMNAVDHPNGGRTKSLKYSKTPWGTTTKFK